MNEHPLLLASLLLFGACGSPSATPSVRQAPAARGSATTDPVPIVDGSRVPCLSAPYAPPAETTALADGSPLRREAEGRRWVITLPGDVRASAEEASALVDRVRARGGIYRFFSYGQYCGDHTCFAYRGNLCEVRVEELARTLIDAVAEDPELPRPGLELVISLVGALGPRCDANDSGCGPVPHDEDTRYDPAGDRNLGALAAYSAGECAHDGECAVMGCGNHCVGWQYGGANAFATCEGYVSSEPLFCGCVSGLCGWFSQ